MAIFKISCAAPALLLVAALLAAGASADDVTVKPCHRRRMWSEYRVRQYPEDSSATYLTMARCGLTELISADLENLPQVQTIYLTFNSIDHINTSALRTVPALETLVLAYNKFREPPVFAEGSCSNLTWLRLDFNMLTAVGAERTFSACRKLETLFLDNNKIKYLHPDAFHNMPELKKLHLEHNRIRSLPNTLFVSNRQLTALRLHNNRLTHLPPDFAISLKRAGAGLGEFFLFDNPWHCACLVELIVDVKRAGVKDFTDDTYFGDPMHKYDGTAPVCVYTGPAPCSRRAPSGLLSPAGEGAR